MKYPGQILTVFFLLFHFVVNAQTDTIQADIRKGCDSLKVEFSVNPAVSYSSLKWNFGNGQSATTSPAIINFITPGSYDVELILNNSDTVIRKGFISVGLTPAATVSVHDTTGYGTFSRIIEAANVNEAQSLFTPYSYKWDIDGTPVASTRRFVHEFDSAGLYNCRLVISDTLGCSCTLLQSLQIADIFLVPNVFSPNNDGQNDEFRITSNGKYFISFKLYSKTGNLVYKTEAKTILWDGKMDSGDDVPEGVYYYIIEVRDPVFRRKSQGFVYIYR